jgi:chromosome segregation ATPase
MLYAKVKFGAAVVLAVALMGGGGALTYRTVAGEPGAGRNLAAPPAQGEPAAPADAEKLQKMLAEKEKEIQELKDRLKALEQLLERNNAHMAAVEQALKTQVGQRGSRTLDGRVEEEDQPPTRTAGSARAVQREQARDEVELLEAQLATKQAQLKAVHISLEDAKNQRVVLPQDARIRREVADLIGQVEVKEAEVKEASVRLAQARRRLAALSPPEAAPDVHRRPGEQRASELDKRLEALAKELEALRREMKKQAPERQ